MSQGSTGHARHRPVTQMGECSPEERKVARSKRAGTAILKMRQSFNSRTAVFQTADAGALPACRTTFNSAIG